MDEAADGLQELSWIGYSVNQVSTEDDMEFSLAGVKIASIFLNEFDCIFVDSQWKSIPVFFDFENLTEEFLFNSKVLKVFSRSYA